MKKNDKLKSGITRRESLQLSVGALAGLAFPFSGFGTMQPKKEQLNTNSSLNIRKPGKLPEDWVQDVVVVAMPAAAVGGRQAGIYTASENGIVPWNNALLRWLTSKSVRGNGAVLVRQEAQKSGAGIASVVDPFAEYTFEILVHVPAGFFFGTAQDDSLQIWLAVTDLDNNILNEKQLNVVKGEWNPGKLSFSSGDLKKVRCVVYAKSAKSFPCVFYVEGFKLTRNDWLWWNSQNYFNSTRTVDQIPDNRKLLIEALKPDAVAGHNGVYINGDKFFTDHGIMVGGGNWEQEYNHVSIDDPMLEVFEENGLARKIDGEKISTSPLWPGYHMCHNAPAYHEHYIKSITRIAPEIHLFSQDNICSPSFLGWKGGCFCKWCKEKFRNWLRDNRNLGIVKNARIENLDFFDIAQYVEKVKDYTIKKGSEGVLNDPILKSYILFHYISQLDLWRDSVNKLKQAANHPIAVMGNQYGNNGSRAYSVALSQISDVVCTESNIGQNNKFDKFDRVKALLLVKLGLASGEYRRPVWLQFSSLFHSPIAAKSRLRFIAAQSLANGGIPFTWATTVGASGWFFDTESEICQFIQQYRFLFSRCDCHANVGLVYSLPTHAWRQYPSFGLSNNKYQKWFYLFANILEEAHVPYEVNCWWHPMLGSDEVSLQRLSRYKVIILPGVDSFTNAQLEALSDFCKNGGVIINLSIPNIYDEYMQPLPDNKRMIQNGMQVIEIEPELTKNYDRLAKTVNAEIAKSLNKDKILNTNAPSHAWSSLRMNESDGVLSLHIVNGDIQEEKDCFRSVESTKWKIRLPQGLTVNKAKLISLDILGKEENIPIKLEDGWVSVVIPVIENYSIVSFYSGNKLSESEKKAKKRRSDIMDAIINS